MKQLVIGLGEVGEPIRELLGADGHDGPRSIFADGYYDVIHICFPFMPSFYSRVRDYQQVFESSLTIIHSTVPIGTTKQIPGAVHSPVLGRHATMKHDLLKFDKWFGGEKAETAAALWPGKVHIVESSDTTEALKLLCLARYGVDIALSELARRILPEGSGYHRWMEWTQNYNRFNPEFKRPLIWLTDPYIGGHCIIPGTKMLAEQFPDKLLDAVLRLEPQPIKAVV